MRIANRASSECPHVSIVPPDGILDSIPSFYPHNSRSPHHFLGEAKFESDSSCHDSNRIAKRIKVLRTIKYQVPIPSNSEPMKNRNSKILKTSKTSHHACSIFDRRIVVDVDLNCQYTQNYSIQKQLCCNCQCQIANELEP